MGYYFFEESLTCTHAGCPTATQKIPVVEGENSQICVASTGLVVKVKPSYKGFECMSLVTGHTVKSSVVGFFLPHKKKWTLVKSFDKLNEQESTSGSTTFFRGVTASGEDLVIPGANLISNTTYTLKIQYTGTDDAQGEKIKSFDSCVRPDILFFSSFNSLVLGDPLVLTTTGWPDQQFDYTLTYSYLDESDETVTERIKAGKSKVDLVQTFYFPFSLGTQTVTIDLNILTTEFSIN